MIALIWLLVTHSHGCLKVSDFTERGYFLLKQRAKLTKKYSTETDQSCRIPRSQGNPSKMSSTNDFGAGGIFDEPTLEELKAVGMRQTALCKEWLEQFDLETATTRTHALAKIETWTVKEMQDREEALSKLNRLVAQSCQGREALSREEQAKVDELRELIRKDEARTFALMLQFLKDTREWSLNGLANAGRVETELEAISFAMDILDKKGLEAVNEHPRGNHVGDLFASWDQDVKMSRLGLSLCRHYESMGLPRRVPHPDMEKGRGDVRE